MPFAPAALILAAALAVQAPPLLLGADETAVAARLGEPLTARREGLGGMWTYRFRTCVLYVFFRAEAGGPLRVSALEAAPLAPGAASPTPEACLAEAPR